MKVLSEPDANKYYQEIKQWHKNNSVPLDTKISELKLIQFNILKEITGKSEEISQWSFLDLKKRTQKNPKGKMPGYLLADMKSLKEWRNKNQHPDPDDLPTTELDYLKHLKTVSTVVKYFSDIEIPLEINNVLNISKKEKTPRTPRTKICIKQNLHNEEVKEVKVEKENAELENIHLHDIINNNKLKKKKNIIKIILAIIGVIISFNILAHVDFNWVTIWIINIPMFILMCYCIWYLFKKIRNWLVS